VFFGAGYIFSIAKRVKGKKHFKKSRYNRERR